MSNNLLAGKKGVIFGALDENSIAWKVAERCVDEGAQITLTNAPVAMRFGKIKELGEKLNAEVIPADATSLEDLENLKDLQFSGGGGLGSGLLLRAMCHFQLHEKAAADNSLRAALTSVKHCLPRGLESDSRMLTHDQLRFYVLLMEAEALLNDSINLQSPSKRLSLGTAGY